MSGRFVDLRSDTLSLPTEAMRTAIADAPLGDDQYGEDRLTIEFEQKAAELVGKEAALLVLSGTMGNLVAAMTHSRLGQEVIVGDDTHFYNAEVAGYARVAGLACRPLPSGPQGLDPAAVEAAIRPGSSTHRPTTGLIIVENTNNRGGGTVVTLERMQQLSEVAARHAVPVHIDGARIFEAAVALGVGPDDLCMWGDSVTFCLTKGLSAPLGAALAGSGDFIAAARRNRQMIGGGMRQSGIIAAAGLVALDSMVDRLAVDARHARTLAEGIASVEGLTVDLERVQTNMVYVDVSGTGFSAETVLQSLRELNVMALSTAPYTIRLCTYQGIDEADIGYAVSAFREIAARGFRPDGINERNQIHTYT